MKSYSSKIITLVFTFFVLFGCKVKKKDFDPDNIEWKDITSEWGVPLIDSRMTIASALEKNKTPLIIDFDANDDDFITLIYLDTVHSPLGEELLKDFTKNIPLYLNNTVGTSGATVLNNVNAGQSVTVSLPSSTLPFEIDEVKSLKEIKLKGGLLNVEAISRLRHNVTLRLKFPEIISTNGDTLKLAVDLKHAPNSSVSTAFIPSINLDGYILKTSAANQLKYAVTAAVEVLNNDDFSKPRNLTSASDSLNFKLTFSDLAYKYVIGEFNQLSFPDTLEGETRFNVFNNAVKGNIRFTRPQIKFDFLNSFGAKISTEIDRARMYFAYDTTALSIYSQELITTPSTPLRIPGTTVFNAPTVMGDVVTTSVTLDSGNSTLRSVLAGAPYKFNYRIPKISLTPANGEVAFVRDDSKIEIQTEVKLPLELRVNNVVIADTIPSLELPKPQYVEYVEFKAGSVNSIPFSIEMQCFFLDSADNILDSLVKPPDLPLIVAPGLPEEYADPNQEIIKKTQLTSHQTIIRMSKERYSKIHNAKKIVVEGRAYTLQANANPAKSVKFYGWQECTFKLAMLAKVNIDLTDPEAVFNVEE